MSKEDKTHVHKYDVAESLKVPLRRYVKEDGKTIADTITGFDLLKIRKCKCGKKRAYDAERSVA